MENHTPSELECPAPDLHAVLAAQLPAAPATVLLLGLNSGSHAAHLQAKGYQVAVRPFSVSQDMAQLPSATRQAIRQICLDIPDRAPGHFDCSLVLDVSPAIHPLALWGQFDHWLADSAPVVFMGSTDANPNARMPNWLDYVAAIAARCGFVEQNVSELAAALGANQFIRAFRKAAAPRWHLRHVREEHFDEIATLFQEVFGHPLSRDLWNWKYANGHGNAVVAARHGALIAHYGGMYRDVMLFGVPDWVFQICDVMVHPKERGVMTRQGPFLLTAATSAEIYGPLGFGFPNARAMQVAEKMGLYSEVGQMASIRWVPSAPRFRWKTRVHAVERASVTGRSQVNALWSEMAHDLRDGVVGVRDWDYVEHRYFGHPHNRYEVLVVTSRLTGKALGAMVLRRDGDACELLDVITPLANLPLVIDQARRLTGLWGLTDMYCWITKNQAQRFVDCGGVQGELNVTIPTSCWTDDPRANVFKDSWWLMSGDTDFR